MFRSLLALIVGAAVTFALFSFMAFLVGGGAKRNANNFETPPIEIVMERQDAQAQNRDRPKPKPPKPPQQPPKPVEMEPDTADVSDSISVNISGPDLGGIDTGLGDPSNAMARDGDATPIVRIEPRYPVKAARDGKEGYVVLSFTINELGGVDDVKVIQAEPRRLFDQEARRALRKWKYKPKIVDGKPVKQPAQQVRLDFSLDKANG
ncbi:energy transducer TonB [Ferrimonas lipolytica]|uniref:Protein TonB n=1 Tax=Ferrimonas lipolytica TaxID=2724191 RepID=A0A6H1UED5_9GAMM|nr:energy transducer TonB [Ferrimonas lipolytica]QIZ77188.1 energy transducer TonB [Ferrimonas lipolytica]